MGILTMKQSIFGNKFKERGLSKNARKAMSSEMYIPTNAVEMTYDEMECVDGGVCFIENGIYFSNRDLECMIGTSAMLYPTYVSASAMCGAFCASISWLNFMVGVGNIIWTIIGVSSLIMYPYLLEAAITRKGVEITVEWVKWFFCFYRPELNIKVR